MITMPPRHGKTTIVSHAFPAYAFGKFPDLTIISTSYAADLSSRINREVQRIIDSDKYRELFPKTTLWGKNIKTVANGTYLRNSDIFEIVGYKGSYRSAGVGGGITGMGGHCLLIDDPIKSGEEANSPTIREGLWEWYLSTLYTRAAPGGGIALIQTRWHEDDLAGRLLEAMRAGEAEKWQILNFPAIAEGDEKYRKMGEALFPEMYPLKDLIRIKKNQSPRNWAALYQQRPAPDEGQIFQRDWIKYWHYGDLPDEFDRVILSWDMSFKETAGSDFVVGQVWGQSGGEFFLIDQIRKRMGFVETVEKFIELTKKYPKSVEKLVEDKANGPAVIDVLKKKMHGIIPIVPEGSKIARAHAVTPLFEAGNVYFPHYEICSWEGDFENEVLTFPSAAHDDQVDAMTQALRRLMGRRGGDSIVAANPRQMGMDMFY
jgi:predicted phage terminase large subunit-like protein